MRKLISCRAQGACLVLVAMAMAMAMPLAAATNDTAAVDRLERYFSAVERLTGDFEQVTRDEQGVVVERAGGAFAMARPQRFNWHYQTPWEQWIVSDGEHLWVHDVDLDQVVVRPLGDALGVGAAQLLSGNLAQLQRDFTIQTGTEDTVRLQPTDPAWSFQTITVHFNGNVPDQLRIEDGMGQQIQVNLNNLQRNPAIDPARFEFEPPAGVDVIRGS